MGFQGAFMAIYPVFAQYKPPVRCETIFDTQKEFRWSVQKQFLRRCNPLKNLIQNIFIVSLLLIKLKILQQGLRFVRTLEKMMTRNVIFVTWLFLMIVRRLRPLKKFMNAQIEKVKLFYTLNLRVVQTQAILFLNSMSESVGSDKERLWIQMTPTQIDFESI